MYREYRDVTLNAAVDTLYNDMAGRHRSRAQSIQIIRTAIVPAKDCKKESSMQFHNSKIKFPLPHRILRAPSKQVSFINKIVYILFVVKYTVHWWI